MSVEATTASRQKVLMMMIEKFCDPFFVVAAERWD
jgi:hypothetical protein